MKAAAVVLGLGAFGGLIVLAVAGVTGATAILGTGVAIVAMIALGNVIGGRTTPNRAPPSAGEVGEADQAGEAGGAEAPGEHDAAPDTTGATEGAGNPEAEQRRGTMGP